LSEKSTFCPNVVRPRLRSTSSSFGRFSSPSFEIETGIETESGPDSGSGSSRRFETSGGSASSGNPVSASAVSGTGCGGAGGSGNRFCWVNKKENVLCCKTVQLSLGEMDKLNL